MKFYLPYVWLLPFMILFSCQSGQIEEHTNTVKPNILFIFADDLSYETIQKQMQGKDNPLGHDVIYTPNLDRLVDMGTSFTHTYNMGGWNGAICVASRSMLISGRYIWQAQELANRWAKKDTSALDHTWGRLMAHGGYDTYMTGKWHVLAPSSYVFDTVRHERPGMPGDAWGKGGGGKRVAEAIRSGEDVAAAMPVGYNRPLSPDDKSWDPTDTTMGGFWEGGKHWNVVLKDDALDFLDQASQDDDPFFMYLAFNAAHDPRQSPQEYLDRYPVEEISVPENFLPEYPGYEKIGLGPGLRDEALAPFPRTEYAVQKHRQEYYALISHMDTQIGKILDALEASGKMNNTYIVFTGDHGLSVGHHGLIGKQNMYEHSMRVPLIIAGPQIPAGERRDQRVYLQDVMPTVLEWAGITPPDYVDFHSLIPMLRDGNQVSPYSSIYGAYMNIHRMVISGDFKLIVYPEIEKILLFNLEKDPQEMNNLADQPRYKEKVQEMIDKLKDLMKEMNDPMKSISHNKGI